MQKLQTLPTYTFEIGNVKAGMIAQRRRLSANLQLPMCRQATRRRMRERERGWGWSTHLHYSSTVSVGLSGGEEEALFRVYV
jgi:hypothetical protein